MSNYYTPEIEEFYVGFEYEQYNNDIKYFVNNNNEEKDFFGKKLKNPCRIIEPGWTKQVITYNNSLPHCQYMIENNEIYFKPFETKVKYLDKEKTITTIKYN